MRDFLLHSGDPCVTFDFVNSGALGAFYRDADDKEAIIFAVADWWITDIPCFVNQQAAMISIEAISDSSVLQLPKADMDQVLVSVPKFHVYSGSCCKMLT